MRFKDGALLFPAHKLPMIIQTDFTPSRDLGRGLAAQREKLFRRFLVPISGSFRVDADHCLHVVIDVSQSDSRAAACEVVSDHKQPLYARVARPFNCRRRIVDKKLVIQVAVGVCEAAR